MRVAPVALLGALFLLVPVGVVRAQELLVSPLTSDYLRDDRTVFSVGNYPEALDVLSPLPEPPRERLPLYAYEVACWLEHHPAVVLGALPFDPPLKVRFHRLPATQAEPGRQGAPQPERKPFFEVTVWGCGSVL